MFTGLIKEIGKVRKLEKGSALYKLEVETKELAKDANVGDSVAIDGVCLTVTRKDKGSLLFDVMRKTISGTTLAGLHEGDLVNLEDALKAGDHIGGHFVLGHIDCIGKIGDIVKRDRDVSIQIRMPEGFDQYIVSKGSIAIDGISLTIGDVDRSSFTVYIIPHTLGATTLGFKAKGEEVNLEFDVIGKYVQKMGGLKEGSKITEDFLKEKGFI